MNITMELRKCCNHPFLIRGAESTVIEEICGLRCVGSTVDALEKLERPAELPLSVQELPPELALKYITYASGKMVVLDKLLPKLRAQGHRVLLFSQMVNMLNIIQDYLTMKGYPFERIDGGVKISDRQAAICAQRDMENRVEVERKLKEAEEKCAAMEYASKRKCEAMEQEAKQKAEAYWGEVSKRLQSFYENHQEIKRLLDYGSPSTHL